VDKIKVNKKNRDKLQKRIFGNEKKKNRGGWQGGVRAAVTKRDEVVKKKPLPARNVTAHCFAKNGHSKEEEKRPVTATVEKVGRYVQIVTFGGEVGRGKNKREWNAKGHEKLKKRAQTGGGDQKEGGGERVPRKKTSGEKGAPTKPCSGEQAKKKNKTGSKWVSEVLQRRTKKSNMIKEP